MKKNQWQIVCVLLLVLSFVMVSHFLKVKSFFTLNNYINDKAYDLKENGPVDTSIILVNIGKLKREQIAILADSLLHKEPRVIGIYTCFDSAKATSYDSLLENSLGHFRNVIMIKREGNECEFSKKAHYFYSSMLVDQNDYVHSFATKSDSLFESHIAELYSPSSFKKLKGRHRSRELINFKGNTESFFTINYDNILQGEIDPDLIRDKIVLVGFLGEGEPGVVNNLETAFYTPLNPRITMKNAIPDMYSLAISANIISTIIDENFIDPVPYFISILMILAIVIFNILTGSLVLKRSFILFMLYALITFAFEVLASGFVILLLLNDAKKMLYLKELPFAIVLGYIGIYFITRKLDKNEKKVVHE